MIAQMAIEDSVEEEDVVTKFLEDIISSIAKEKDASINLAECALDFVGRYIYLDSTSDDAASFANMVVALGEDVITSLQLHRTYYAGALRYHYHSRIGDDIIIARIDVDPPA